MSWKLFIMVLSIVTLPIAAQSQQPGGKAPQAGPKPTPADVQRVVKTISADKAKVQVYCDMAKLDGQMAEAEQKKDQKKLEELGKQQDDLAQKLGPEYTALMTKLEQVDPSSPDGQKLAAAFDPLDKQCGGR